MKLTSKQLGKAIMKQRTVPVGNRWERAMKRLLAEEMPALTYLFDQHVGVVDPQTQKAFRFQLDFVIPGWVSGLYCANDGKNCCTVLEINGGPHMTKRARAKDGWEARLMLGRTVERTSFVIGKVIEYDWEFLKLKKHRPLAVAELRKAFDSDLSVYWADA